MGTSSTAMGTASEEHTPPSLGVLFVHGMGEQQRGDTLLGFGEPIVKFLRKWVIEDPRIQPDGTIVEPEPMADVCRNTRAEARARAEALLARPREPRAATATDPFKSNIDLHEVEAIRVLGSDPNVPSHATIKVSCRPDLRPWLLAESWWAADFKPATFTDVLNWGVRVVPFVLLDTARYQARTLGIIERDRAKPRAGEKGLNISDVLQLAFTVVTGPFMYAILLLLMPIASLPFLRGLLGNVMLRLARSVGDPYLLLSSPIRLASMVERVHHDIRWLRDQGCTGIAIVAHSQGAAVAHHALRSFPKADHTVPFTRFVTIGAAVEKLHYLQQIDVRGKNLLRGGLVQAVSALGVLFTVLFAWRIPEWRRLNEAWGYESLFLTIALWLLFTTLFWLGPKLLDVVGIIDLIKYQEPKATDLWDRTNHNAPDAPKAKWIDLYARADPVSLGPIEAINTESPHPLTDPDATSAEIRNQDSMLFDHTSYFQNTSQFMVPLVGGLCRDAGWDEAILDQRQPVFQLASDARARRLDWLDRAGAVIVATVAVTAVALLSLRALDDAGIPLKRLITFLADQFAIPLEGVVKDQVGSGSVAEVVLGIATLVLGAIAYHAIAVKGAWRRWDDARTEALLGQRVEIRRLAAEGKPDAEQHLLGTFTDGADLFIAVFMLIPLLALLAGYILAT